MLVKCEGSVAFLWLIAILSTLWILDGAGYFAKLAPLFFVCMAGNLLIVRRCRTTNTPESTDTHE